MLKLNVGCGNDIKPGYVNIDLYNEKADLQCPAHAIPYEAGSADEIFSSHMIEHLTPQEFEMALKEWRRLLKPGGKLIIRCPNFELYVREFLEGDYNQRWGWGITNLLGWQDRGPGYWNHNGFTVRRLRAVLGQAGFDVKVCYTMQTRMKRGPEYRPNGDIYAEAIR